MAWEGGAIKWIATLVASGLKKSNHDNDNELDDK